MENRNSQTYGPMLGHGTSSTLRIWLRAGVDLRGDAVKVECYLKLNEQLVETKIFGFIREFDYIGLIEFGTEIPLQANTKYSYEIVYSKVAARQTQLASGKARTFSNNGLEEVSFIAGSCRHLYVGKGNGGQVEWETTEEWDNRDQNMREGDEQTEYGDLVFKRILENKDKYNVFDVDFALMMGDQIYADHAEGTFGLPYDIGTAKTLADFYDHYHRAWGQHYYSSLAKDTPFYMVMDDHELINDFRADMYIKGIDKKYKKNGIKYKNGLKAYLCYQASLSSVIKNPENLHEELKVLSSTKAEEKFTELSIPFYDKSKNLNYQFSHGCSEFFCMDVRTERVMKTNSPQLIGHKQLTDLKTWLSARNEDKVKFIVTSVPIFPDTQLFLGAVEDKWGGFAEQRFEILEYIRTHSIKKVVFLSGDVHVSIAAELVYVDESNNQENLGIYTIISSGFTWPIPGLSRHHFSWDRLAKKSKTIKAPIGNKVIKRKPDPDHTSCYLPIQRSKTWRLIDDPHADNSYCHIKTNGKTLDCSFFLRDKSKTFKNEVYENGRYDSFTFELE